MLRLHRHLLLVEVIEVIVRSHILRLHLLLSKELLLKLHLLRLWCHLFVGNLLLWISLELLDNLVFHFLQEAALCWLLLRLNHLLLHHHVLRLRGQLIKHLEVLWLHHLLLWLDRHAMHLHLLLVAHKTVGLKVYLLGCWGLLELVLRSRHLLLRLSLGGDVVAQVVRIDIGAGEFILGQSLINPLNQCPTFLLLLLLSHLDIFREFFLRPILL